MGIIAALLGALGPRFWWKGLALLAILAAAGTLVGTWSAANDYNVALGIVPGWSWPVAFIAELIVELLCFVIGAGLAWLVKRLFFATTPTASTRENDPA